MITTSSPEKSLKNKNDLEYYQFDMDLVPDQFELEDECFRLSSSGWSLREIKKWLLDTHQENKGLGTINEWIHEASIRKFQRDSQGELKVQQSKALAEYEEKYRDIQLVIQNRVIRYKYLSKDGTIYEEDIKVSPMVIAQLLKTQVDILDRKNDIRGLSAKTLVQLNQYNNDIHLSDDELSKEFGSGDPKLLEQLRSILGKPTKVVETHECIEVDESPETDGESSGVREGSTE